MRIVHFADLHLDAPFRRLPTTAARARRQALRRTLDAIVDLAHRERADAITCAGDLFEATRLTPDTLAFLRDRLGAADCPVFVSPGNHDWVSPTSPYATTSWPDNVRVFQSRTLTPVELAPGLVLFGAAHHAPAGTGNLLTGARATAGAVCLALFHGSDRQSFPFQGADKEQHAPFDAADVRTAGFAHALVGHYHVPAEAADHTYPGNPDPLTFGETGVRGAVVVDVAADGSVKRGWRAVAQSAVCDVSVDLSGAAHRDQIIERVRAELAGLAGSIRLRVSGEVPAEIDFDAARDLDPDALAIPRGPERALVVEVGDLRWRYDLAALAREPSVRGELVRRLAAARDVTDDDRELVLRVALRALAGRDDLEVV